MKEIEVNLEFPLHKEIIFPKSNEIMGKKVRLMVDGIITEIRKTTRENDKPVNKLSVTIKPFENKDISYISIFKELLEIEDVVNPKA